MKTKQTWLWVLLLLSLLSPRKLGQDNLFSQFRQIQSFRLSFELWDFGHGEIVF